MAVATLVSHPLLVALALALSPDWVFQVWREGALVVVGYSWDSEVTERRRRLIGYLVTFLGCAHLLRESFQCVAGLLSEPLHAVRQAGAETLDRVRQALRGVTTAAVAAAATVIVPGVLVASESPSAARRAVVRLGVALGAILVGVHFAPPTWSARAARWSRRLARGPWASREERVVQSWGALVAASNAGAIRRVRWAVVQRLQRKWHRLGVFLQVCPWAADFRRAFPSGRARRAWSPGGTDPFHDWPVGPLLRWQPLLRDLRERAEAQGAYGPPAPPVIDCTTLLQPTWRPQRTPT